MRPQLLSSLFLLATVGLASPAAAGGYITVGLGNAADLRGDFAAQYDSSAEGDSGRVGVGQRFGPLAIEANVMGTDLEDDRSYSLSVELKYHYDLGGGLELVGKGGLGKTWINVPDPLDDKDGVSGRSKQLGLGLQYGFKGPIGQMAIWADYTRQYLELSGDSILEGELDMMQLGLTVGL